MTLTVLPPPPDQPQKRLGPNQTTRWRDGKPLRSLVKAQRRREWFIERMSKATTPAERIAVAFDYFRAALRDRRVTGAQADAASEAVTHALITYADQLTDHAQSAAEAAHALSHGSDLRGDQLTEGSAR